MSETDENLIKSFFHCRRCVLEDAATNIAVGLTGDGAHLQSVVPDPSSRTRNVYAQRSQGADGV